MIDNLFVIDTPEQIRVLSSEMKLRIINELIKNSATCQQLADIFGLSKQKVHYNLKSLIAAKLIYVEKNTGNDKEKYYRSAAKNYVIDFSLGKNVNNSDSTQHRPLINSILKEDYNINLGMIAANLLENSLKLKPREKLLIVSGDYNMPLVEHLIIEATKRQIFTTLLYRNRRILQAKHDDYSLAAYQWDYETFNRLLKDHNVYLYLNGESRFIPLTDPEKIPIHQAALAKNMEAIEQKQIRVAMMPGLINSILKEENIMSEISFWRSLDIDYSMLRQEIDQLISSLSAASQISFDDETGAQTCFQCSNIFGEYGAFTDSPHQSPVINLPGGEVLMIPRENSFNGVIHADAAYINGETILHPCLTIENNKITAYEAGEKNGLIAEAIESGGKDGDLVALVCLGTNFRMNSSDIDLSYINKSKGMLTIYWGNNVPFGGSVTGKTEWYIQLKNPRIEKK